MARQESDREDLLAEAVALVRRLECRLANTEVAAAVVAGFRANGWLSVYLGPDPVYQFDEQGRLRRAYRGNLLYRTQGGTLASLRRSRTEAETQLIRRDLTEEELTQFHVQLVNDLERFATALETGNLHGLVLIPADAETLPQEIAAHLRRALQIEPWLAPAIGVR